MTEQAKTTVTVSAISAIRPEAAPERIARRTRYECRDRSQYLPRDAKVLNDEVAVGERERRVRQACSDNLLDMMREAGMDELATFAQARAEGLRRWDDLKMRPEPTGGIVKPLPTPAPETAGPSRYYLARRETAEGRASLASIAAADPRFA